MHDQLHSIYLHETHNGLGQPVACSNSGRKWVVLEPEIKPGLTALNAVVCTECGQAPQLIGPTHASALTDEALALARTSHA